jgi:hypothetical protein
LGYATRGEGWAGSGRGGVTVFVGADDLGGGPQTAMFHVKHCADTSSVLRMRTAVTSADAPAPVGGTAGTVQRIRMVVQRVDPWA